MVKRKRTQKQLNGLFLSPIRKRRNAKQATAPAVDLFQDSDDELPVPTFLQLTEDDELDFKINDLVWAKWKSFYWPAVITKLNIKTKQVGILYVDEIDAKQCHWLRRDCVIHYGSSKRSVALRRQQVKVEWVDKFNTAIKVTDDYLGNCAVNAGCIEPVAFFRSPLLYCVKQYIRQRYPDGVVDDQPVEDDTASAASSSNTSSEAVETSSQKPQLTEANQAKLQELLTMITGNACKDHILGILSGNIKNRRNKMFFFNAPSKRRTLKIISGFGPFRDDQDLVHGHYTYLTRLLREKYGKSCPFDSVSYVFDVWIPESMLYALQHVFNFTARKAQQVFQAGQSIIDIMNECK